MLDENLYFMNVQQSFNDKINSVISSSKFRAKYPKEYDKAIDDVLSGEIEWR